MARVSCSVVPSMLVAEDNRAAMQKLSDSIRNALFGAEVNRGSAVTHLISLLSLLVTSEAERKHLVCGNSDDEFIREELRREREETRRLKERTHNQEGLIDTLQAKIAGYEAAGSLADGDMQAMGPEALTNRLVNLQVENAEVKRKHADAMATISQMQDQIRLLDSRLKDAHASHAASEMPPALLQLRGRWTAEGATTGVGIGVGPRSSAETSSEVERLRTELEKVAADVVKYRDALKEAKVVREEAQRG